MVLLDWPYIGLPPYGCTIHFEEILSCFVLTVFLVKLSKRGSYLHNTNIWVIFYQNLGIWPPAIGVTLHCLLIISKKSHHDLSWMYVCGYFGWSNESNYEVICIVSIFGMICCQNMGIWPHGVIIQRVTPYCFAIHF